MLYQNESVFMNLSKYFWKLYEHSEAKSGLLHLIKIEQLDKYLYMKQIVIKYTFNVFRL